MIDLHCHILPGLDDGADTLEESCAMARIAREDGITAIVATPHLFRGSRWPDDFASIEKGIREFRSALHENNIALEVKPGAEVHITHNLVRETQTHRSRLVINGSAYMFIEFPSSHIYPGTKELIFALMSEQILPIITHPERNSALARDPGILHDLVKMGALVQVNSGSLIGLYGRQAAEVVVRLLKWNLVHFLASDGHNASSLPPRLSEATRIVEAAIGKEPARFLVEDNPRAVLDDREIPFLPTPIDPRKSKKSLSLRIPSFLKRSH